MENLFTLMLTSHICRHRRARAAITVIADGFKLELIDRRGFIRAYKNNGIECAKLTIPTHGIIIVPTLRVGMRLRTLQRPRFRLCF